MYMYDMKVYIRIIYIIIYNYIYILCCKNSCIHVSTVYIYIYIFGWWFRSFFIFPFSWEFHHPNWRTPSFFRGVKPPIIELDYGKFYRKTLYLMVKTMVSCRFSLKPIQWTNQFIHTYIWIYVTDETDGRPDQNQEVFHVFRSPKKLQGTKKMVCGHWF